MTADARRQPSPGSTSPDGEVRGAETGGAGPPLLDQVFDDDSLYALRSAVAAHGSQAGLAEGRLGDLVLVVHELAANAIRHGAGRGRLRIWNTGTELHCEVTDDGINHGSGGDAEAGGRDPAHWSIEPGHGLWVIRQVADRASLNGSPAGTVATVAFTLGAPGTLPPFRLAQQVRDDCVVLSVTGQLDLGSAREFTRTFDGIPADGAASRLILDLSGLTGWDSCGLAALITAQQLVDNHPGARMIVAGLAGHLRQRLLAVDLPRRFTLAESIDDAGEV
jgi:anti-anti-sigma factor